MRRCIPAILVAMLLSAPANAGFVIRLQVREPSGELQPDQPNQAVDVYLKPDFDALVNSVQIGAFFGDSKTVVGFDTQADFPSTYRGSEGNFLKTNDYIGGFSIAGADYFWPAGEAVGSQNEQYYGSNATQIGVGISNGRNRFKAILAGDEVKIGTFHVDTTGVTAQKVTMSLYDEDGDLQYALRGTPVPQFTLTQVIAQDPLDPALDKYFAVSDPSLLTISGGTFNIASTPEPAVIGLAGLSLTAGLGWLRARRRGSSQLARRER